MEKFLTINRIVIGGQVLSLHLAAEKFVSLIPLILSNEDIQILEVEWKREIIAVSVASKLRILAGK